MRRLYPFGLVLAVVAVGCVPGRAALLGNVSVGPATLSPGLRQSQNHVDITYALGAPASVSAYIRAGDGRQWVVYEDQPRPTAGEYTLGLDGTVPGPGQHERRVLPDGDYRVVVRATAGDNRQEVDVPIAIAGADTSAPEVQNLQLFPDRISPNFDAIDDITRISYRVTKDSRVTPFADEVLQDGRRQRRWTGEEVKVEAGEQRIQWDGTVSGVPLPAGSYEVGVRAQDSAGNVSETRRPLAIEASGVPEAKIVWAQISPREIVRGGQVCADVTVRNIGQTVLRTEGPDPRYVYNSFDTYSSIAGHDFVEHAGYWRVGLDWAGSADTAGARYPFRWGFGNDLGPGEEATVHGCVQVNDERQKMVFFAALIQENVAIRESGTGLTQVLVSP